MLENNTSTRSLKLLLKKHQFELKKVSNKEKIIPGIIEMQPDLIILDTHYSGKDSVTLCKEIRTFVDIPIILTSKNSEMDRVAGLQAGADDCICKPFSSNELVLRIKAVLRRCQFRAS